MRGFNSVATKLKWISLSQPKKSKKSEIIPWPSWFHDMSALGEQLRQLNEAMLRGKELALRLEQIHAEWRSQQEQLMDLCSTTRTLLEAALPAEASAQDAQVTLEYSDYTPEPEEVEMTQQAQDSFAEPEVECLEDELTQPAENTQASQERLLLPENRIRLGKRFARFQMAKLSSSFCEHDASDFDPNISTEELGKGILADLERIPDKEWVNHGRENVRPAGKASSLQMTLGLVTMCHWRGIPMPTRKTYQFRNLVQKIFKYAEHLGFDLGATTIQLTKDFQSKLHKDKNNKGPSGIFGLGDWVGGETFVQEELGSDTYTLTEDIPKIGKKGDRLQGRKLDIHRLQCFDGNKPHATMDFDGRRYAIVLFCIGKSYEQTPGLVREFLRKLGFPLPFSDFKAPIHRDYEEMAEMAIRGSLVDEPGRHEPPAGRRGKRLASPARAVEALEAPEVWTEEQQRTLREMKSNKKAKYSWEVVAKRIQKSIAAAKEKWLEIK